MTKLGIAMAAMAALAGSARADQCQWVEPKAAASVATWMPKGAEWLAYCEPCGDKQPARKAPVKAIEIRQTSDPKFRQVAIDGEEVDLAYVFVKRGADDYANVAKLVGCPAEGVSKSITRAGKAH